MARKLKPGSVVQLQSGGPLMTVNREMSDGGLECAYFCPDVPCDEGEPLDFYGPARFAVFAPASLARVNLKAPAPPRAPAPEAGE